MRFVVSLVLSSALAAGILAAGAALAQDAGAAAPVTDSGHLAPGPSLVHGRPDGVVVMMPHGPGRHGFAFPAAPHGMMPFPMPLDGMHGFAALDPATLDADGNGEVTIDEIQAARQTQFAGIDANGDGRVDATEIQAHLERQETERRRRQAESLASWLDTNNDGAISAEEFVASLSHTFTGGAPGATVHIRQR